MPRPSGYPYDVAKSSPYLPVGYRRALGKDWGDRPKANCYKLANQLYKH
ncbi:hypothetical protein H6H01_35535 [Nostoc calcicola FACHB-3891]|nr:hypothetical protein [Nostoc calcicola FACHB-3891]